LKISGIYSKNHPAIDPKDLVTKARSIMRSEGVRILPVIDDSRKLLGVISRVHILSVTSTKSNMLVNDVMIEPSIIVTPEDDVIATTKSMIKLDEWYAPVVSSTTVKTYLGVYGLENFIELFKDKLRDLQVKGYMTTNVISCKLDDSVASLWRKMIKYRYAGFPVVNNSGKVVGIVTQHDLLARGISRIEFESDSGPRQVKIKEIMTTPAFTVYEDEKLEKVANEMLKRNIGRIIVVENKGKLKGIIDREDIVKAILSRI